MKRLIKFIKSLYINIFIFKKKGINISLLAFVDEYCKFDKNTYIDRFCNLHNVKISQYSYVGYGTSISHCDIGKFCSIGPDVKIGLGKHPTNFVSTSPVFYSEMNPLGVNFVKGSHFLEYEKTIIGNDVWIGANAIIMDGVKVGDGAIIAAGAVVTKDVEPYAIVGGIPAKLLRYRFDREIIKELLIVKWWDWNYEKINDNIDDFRNVERFIK